MKGYKITTINILQTCILKNNPITFNQSQYVIVLYSDLKVSIPTITPVNKNIRVSHTY